jgi:xylan 1,4-beta-xylosidase
MNRRNFLLTASGTLLTAAAAPQKGAPVRPRPAVLLHGEFPDPTVVRVGGDFYMTHSHSEAHVPGLLIWHSSDLYTWKPIGHALPNYVGILAAPDLTFHKGLFYIYYPAHGSNWVVTAKSPAGPWSDPVDLKVGNIDPGHVAGPDGKRYLHLSGGKMAPLADDGLSILEQPKTIYEGWKYPDSWVVECFCLESPKLVFHNGYYYLTSAQGGTTGPTTSHMAVSARSRSPIGPWENSPYNPIVHTSKASERWWSRGHATLIDDPQGRWYIVYHAYENGARGLGRQTLIEPVSWTPDGWYKPVAAGKDFNPEILRNYAPEADDFAGPGIKPQWSFIGVQSTADFKLGGGSIALTGAEGQFRALQCRPSDRNYETSIQLEGPANTEAGFVLFYSPHAYAGVSRRGGRLVSLRQGNRYGGFPDDPPARYFKLRLVEGDLSTFTSADGQTWKQQPNATEVSGYHANALGGFDSLRIAAYIKGAGELKVRSFTYRPLA